MSLPSSMVDFAPCDPLLQKGLSLRVSATFKYTRHIEFINLNPGLSQMSPFHMQKHDRCEAKHRPAGDTQHFRKISVIACLKEI